MATLYGKKNIEATVYDAHGGFNWRDHEDKKLKGIVCDPGCDYCMGKA
ncbi:MAG: hypothetical protein AABW49_04625 [Nanoarchaeota archaeon]